jgi:hypothetical protein
LEPSAFAVAIEGDTILYFNGRYASKSKSPLVGWNYATAMKSIERSLADKFGPGVLTGAAMFGQSAGDGPTVDFDCFLENRGWHSLQVKMRPLSEVRTKGPEVISLPPGNCGGMPITIRVEQPDGHLVPLGRKLRLKARELHNGVPVMPEVELGRKTIVPWGEYAIDDQSNPVLASLAPGHWITVAPDRNATFAVTLPVRLTPGSICVRSEVASVGVRQVELTASGLAPVRIWVRDSYEDLLPTGSVTVRVGAASPFRAYERSFVVPDSGQPAFVDVCLDAEK